MPASEEKWRDTTGRDDFHSVNIPADLHKAWWWFIMMNYFFLEYAFFQRIFPSDYHIQHKNMTTDNMLLKKVPDACLFQEFWSTHIFGWTTHQNILSDWTDIAHWALTTET